MGMAYKTCSAPPPLWGDALGNLHREPRPASRDLAPLSPLPWYYDQTKTAVVGVVLLVALFAMVVLFV